MKESITVMEPIVFCHLHEVAIDRQAINELLPILDIIARDHKLNLNRLHDMQKACRILKIYIRNN